MKQLFADIEHITPQLSDWCGVNKAQTLAALVIGLRPSVTVELGVWQGASAIPMAMAHKEIGHGILYAVDPWSGEESLAGQVTQQDKEWWGKVDHNNAYNVFAHYVHHYGVQDVVRVVREKSDDFTPPEVIELLHVDGRHDEGAIHDVERFAPHVPLGKIVVMDDLDWVGGAVRKAEARLLEMGFVQLYPLGSGAVYQRLKWPEPYSTPDPKE
jgi:predicted O-methyltransferase YrrM